MRRLGRLLAVFAALVLTACGTLPAKSPPKLAHPIQDLTQTALGRVALASVPAGAPSGFRLLPQAGQAFEAREQIIGRAEKKIDAQYYFIAGDASGLAFLGQLEEAAARGVQVRLLVDDLHTAEIDPLLARLAALPNFEVRLFNPFCCARASVLTRFMASGTSVLRLNHRMHNKLLIADRSLAIAGGRNIADEYFARSQAYEFIDIDALMAGDIVTQLGWVFDRYWGSDPVWPALDILAAWAPPAGEALQSAQASGKPPAPEFPVEDVLGQQAVGIELAKGKLDLVPGSAYAFADSPTKVLGQDEEYLQETSVTTRARETILTAQSEVVVSTPYLIPRAKGMAFLGHLHDRQVQVRVLTNGIASNDSFFAHAGYAHYRHRMLQQGVELYELSAGGIGAGERAGAGLRRSGAVGRLHAKAFVIDRRTAFIGSMNLDPRSADKNTELGILVESPALAEQMIQVIDANRRLGSFRVKLDDATSSTLEWVVDDGTLSPRVLTSEPDAGVLNWLEELLYITLIPESVL